MPIDSILVSVAVVTMFVLFAGVLAWGERRARLQATGGPRTGRRSF
jgi:hypothetical protein